MSLKFRLLVRYVNGAVAPKLWSRRGARVIAGLQARMLSVLGVATTTTTTAVPSSSSSSFSVKLHWRYKLVVSWSLLHLVRDGGPLLWGAWRWFSDACLQRRRPAPAEARSHRPRPPSLASHRRAPPHPVQQPGWQQRQQQHGGSG